ncbi:MAG: TetR family transcriptional regulator [Actinobacteria bacterium]|nr:TetR family transcriptional regulator [Actinomycetota bacterium]
MAIRKAAIGLFFEHGYAAVGIRQIAAAMSMSSSTLYHYCESKLRLLEAIMVDSNEILQARSEAAMREAEEPRLRFAQLAMTLVATQIESRRTCYVMDNEMRSVSPDSASGRRVFEQRDAYESLWEEAIAAGVGAGLFTTRNADVARVGLIGMYSQTSLWYRPNRALDRADLCREMVDLGLASLGAARLADADADALLDTIDFVRFPWEPGEEERPSAGFPRYAELMTPG